ncbi:unnamed protein product [Clavelina lepadiformis]|uniref:Uncharacterized protein n=1 Tax=Clavelina lepadiformis TaxID=159417 RepID=A0ABP0FIZ7_CLALP
MKVDLVSGDYSEKAKIIISYAEDLQIQSTADLLDKVSHLNDDILNIPKNVRRKIIHLLFDSIIPCMVQCKDPKRFRYKTVCNLLVRTYLVLEDRSCIKPAIPSETEDVTSVQLHIKSMKDLLKVRLFSYLMLRIG